MKERTRNNFDSIWNKNKNDHRWKDYSKKINKKSIQYLERTIMNDYINKISLSRDNFEKRLNKKK